MTDTWYWKKTKVTGNGLFTISGQGPRQIEAGGTIRFSIFFKHQRDGPVNPTNLSCKVYSGPQSTTLLTTLTTYQDIYGTGSYFAEYNVPSNQGSGPLYVVWSGTYQSEGTTGSEPVQFTEPFRVTNPSGWVN